MLLTLLVDITILANKAGMDIFQEELRRKEMGEKGAIQKENNIEKIKKHGWYSSRIEKKIIELNEALEKNDKASKKSIRKQLHKNIKKITGKTRNTRNDYIDFLLEEIKSKNQEVG